MAKPGRPKSNATIIAQKMREELVKRVNKDFAPIIQAQIDLAKGVVINKKITLGSGKTIDHYYELKPDVAASKNLVEQAIGKAQDSLKLSGEVKTITELVSELDKEHD